jgi:hypothetical protein
MKKLSLNSRVWFNHFLTVLMVTAVSGFSQTDIRVTNVSSFEGITLQIPENIISRQSNYLIISDSLNRELALISFGFNEKDYWIKESLKDSESPNVIHWSFDLQEGSLIIDLSSIREDLSDGGNIEILVVPFNSKSEKILLHVFEASSLSNNLKNNAAKLDNLEVELK